MPIEIRELVIKVTVQDEPGGQASPAVVTNGLSGAELRQLQREVTQACVRQVLDTLKQRRER